MLTLIAKYLGMGGGGKSFRQKIGSLPEGFSVLLFAKNELEKKGSRSTKMFWQEQTGQTPYFYLKMLIVALYNENCVRTSTGWL
jgi:hypothetical protein